MHLQGSKPQKKQAEAGGRLRLFLGLLFDPGVGGDMFL
jgi:hypothetical protein